MATFNVLGFAGSLRQKSYNRALLRTAQEVAPATLSIEIFDLDNIPVYNGDVEAQGYPAPVQEFRAKIAAADAILIATPEYNYSVPGVLKNAIDWASRPPQPPFGGKPAAIMGASGGISGTMRAQGHLRQIMLCLNLHAMNRPEIFVAQAQQKFDADGQLTDAQTREFLGKFLAAFSDWIGKFKTPAQ